MLYHLPNSKKVAPRMSRHDYDLFQLSQSRVHEQAMNRLDLLDRVATHKSVFFKAAWANYNTACPGTLRLVPPEKVLSNLKRDYTAMQPMFFGEPTAFETIMEHLEVVERIVNGQKKGS